VTGDTGIGTSFEDCIDIDDEVYDTDLNETIRGNCDNSEFVPAMRVPRELSEHRSDMLMNAHVQYTHTAQFSL